MQPKWRKLLSREEVDLTTISGIDVAFYNLIWEFTKAKEELFFTYFRERNLTHYIGVNVQDLGFHIFENFFNSADKIKKYYQDGNILLGEIQKATKMWQREIKQKTSNKLFLLAFSDFENQLAKINHIYSIGAWFAIEAWQNKFEKILSRMIKRNNLDDKQERILASIYRPWRKTAILEIRQKLNKGIDPKKLARDYQFLRSWLVIWYNPIDESWIKQVKKGARGERKDDYSMNELIGLLKPDREEERYLKLAPYLIFFKDWRDDLRRKFVYLWNFLFQNIAKKYNLPYDDLGYLTLSEIKELICTKKAPYRKIKRRRNNPCIVTAEVPSLKMKIIDQYPDWEKYLAIKKIVEEKIKTPDTPKQRWQKLASREADLTLISAGVLPSLHRLLWDFAKTKKELLFTIFQNRIFTHYIGIDPRKFGLFIFQKFFNTPQKIKKLCRAGNILLQRMEKKTKEWQKKLNVKSPSQLFLSAYKDYEKDALKTQTTYNITPWFGIEAWQNEFNKMLNKMIERNNLQKNREKIITSVYKPWKKTAIPEIYEKVRKGIQPEKLVQEYQFLRSWCVIWYKPITEVWVRDIARGSKNLLQEKLYSKEDLIKLLKPNEKERHNLELAPYLTFFRDWRDELRRKHVYLWNFLFQLIAQKLNVPYDDLGYLTQEEIKAAITANKINQGLLEHRKNNPVIYTIDVQKVKMKVIDQKAAIKKYLAIIKEATSPRKKILKIKGIVAQSGVARGKVKIVKTQREIKEVKKGDILVANTTHPNYLPAMQKAAAIVTNEGGMACHAAICARELKKPCLVGTKIATQVLKDRDMVEVDAEKGVVRILGKEGKLTNPL